MSIAHWVMLGHVAASAWQGCIDLCSERSRPLATQLHGSERERERERKSRSSDVSEGFVSRFCLEQNPKQNQNLSHTDSGKLFKTTVVTTGFKLED